MLPGAADSSVVGGRVDTEDADPWPDVNHHVGVRIVEVKRSLLAALRVAWVSPVVTLGQRVVAVDVVDALDQAVQLVKLVELELHLLEQGRHGYNRWFSYTLRSEYWVAGNQYSVVIHWWKLPLSQFAHARTID